MLKLFFFKSRLNYRKFLLPVCNIAVLNFENSIP